MSGDAINSDLIRGNIDTIILRALYEGDRYGYDILKEIEQRSKGQYQLKQPTLYSSLKRLETQGFIRSYWGAKSIGGRRKYFTLTDMGKEVFVRNKADWEYSRTLIDTLISMTNETVTSPADSLTENTDHEYDKDFVNEDNESFDEDELTAENLYNNEEDSTNDRHNVNESATDNNQLSSTDNEDKNHIGDAVVFIDEAENEDNESITEAPAEIFDSETLDKEINLSYSSEYSEKQSYMGIMRDKTYIPEKAETNLNNLDLNYKYSDYDDLDDDENDDFFKDAEETYHEHGEIETPIQFAHKNASTTFEPYRKESDKNQTQSSPTPSKPEFYSYHSNIKPVENVVLPESDGTALLSKFDEKLKQKNNEIAQNTQTENVQQNIETENTVTPAPIRKDPNELNYGQKIQIRKFDTIAQTVSQYGDELVIRKHDENVSREYNNKYYYYTNKLGLFKYGILFGLMLLEIIFTYCIIQFGLKPGIALSQTDKIIYILAVVFAALFPIGSIICSTINYNKRRRSNFNLWISLAYRFIFMIQALLIIYALNLYCSMPLSTSPEYYVSFILPSVLTINIPIAAIIFNKLLKTGKFNVGA